MGCYGGLEVGARVRQYGRKVYGMDCHDWTSRSREPFEPSAVAPIFSREPVAHRIIK